MRQPRFNSSFAMLAAVVAVSFLAGGCSRAAKYRADATPDVDTLSQSHEEIENMATVMRDENLRAMNGDIGRFLMFNRPSRLTPHPVAW